MVNELFVTGVVIELQDAIYGRKFRFVLEEKGPAKPFQTASDSWLWCFWRTVDNNCLIMRAIDTLCAVSLEDSWQIFLLILGTGMTAYLIAKLIIADSALIYIYTSFNLHANYLPFNSSICAPFRPSHTYLLSHSALLGSGGSCFTLAKPNMPYHRLHKMTLHYITWDDMTSHWSIFHYIT